MVLLTRAGRYKGTTKIAEYNKSDAHRKKASELAMKRKLTKGSRGFNSEHADRIRNYQNLINRESNDKIRYLYLMKFDNSIKVGSTSTLDRRIFTLDPVDMLFLAKGGSHDIAKLELDTLVEFEYHTLLNEDKTAYTEHIDSSQTDNVISYLNKVIEGSTTIQKVEYQLVK
jgi:hypothetical protein